jgi:PhoPQ-activated pathogenicity-related protein
LGIRKLPQVKSESTPRATASARYLLRWRIPKYLLKSKSDELLSGIDAS